MTDAPRYFKDVAIGELLPTLEKEIRLTDMMAYGAATWDFARIHYDAIYARKQGLALTRRRRSDVGRFLAQLVQDWAGPQGFLRSLDFQNRGMVFPGDVVTCGGHVTDIRREGSNNLVECSLWIDNQNGKRVVGPASATVSLPTVDEPK